MGAVSLNEEGRPRRAKFTPLPGFTHTTIAAWASDHLSPQSNVVSDGLACFPGVTDAGFAHQPTVVGSRKPRDLPIFHRVHTLLDNLKTSFSGAYHSFRFSKYAERYLGAIADRFDRRFALHALPKRLLAAAALCGPCTAQRIRLPETHCQSGGALSPNCVHDGGKQGEWLIQRYGLRVAADGRDGQPL